VGFQGCGGSKDGKDGKKEEHEDDVPKPAAKPEEEKPAVKPEEGKPAAKPEAEPEAKPAAKPEAASAAEREPWLSDDLESMMNDYFTRYDLDGSGTINSNDELKQLCTNLVVKLELDMDVQTIDKKVNGAGDMEKLCWNFQTFKKWFVSKEEFAASPFWIANDCSDSDDAPENEMAGFMKTGTYKVTMKSDGHDDVVFEFKLRYKDADKEEDEKDLLSRTYCDEALGSRVMTEDEKKSVNKEHRDKKVPYGLHTVSGKVNNKEKTIHFEKSYDVDRDTSTKEPHFVFSGKQGENHTKAAGTWKDTETDPAAQKIRDILKVGTSGTFTIVKNKKED